MFPLRIVLPAALVLLAATPAAADPYRIYFERQRGTTVTIEHEPVARAARVTTRRVTRQRVARTTVTRRVKTTRRVVRYRGIAGGCREGGLVRRVVNGQRVVLQREVCHGIEIRLTGHPATP